MQVLTTAPPPPPGEEPIPVEEPPKPPPKSDLLVEKPWPQEHSLCLFGPRNGIRRQADDALMMR